jgi:aminopeptidase N
MASYLATIDIGQWDVTRWRTPDGLPVYDAVDPALTGELRNEIDSSLARQDEILDLLAGSFGPYPFGTVGGIVDSQPNLFFALETQTRPVYPKYFWLDGRGNPTNGDYVVAHELAHQWFGDDVALARWRDIWLNEGFATYAEWLWAEQVGPGTPETTFRRLYDALPADSAFWELTIGDPGPEHLFADEVYVRGAMTVQALRDEIGDAAFFRLLRRWTSSRSGGNGTTGQFVELAEGIADRPLDSFFDAWLYTPAKPPPPPSGGARERGTERAGAGPDWLRIVRERLRRGRY